MKTAGNINAQIADFYAPLFLEGVKYSESQINIWTPGGGKTVIISDILSSKSIIKSVLKEKSKNIKFVPYSCDKTENATAKEVLINIGADLGLTEKELGSGKLALFIADKCNKIALKNNKDIILVGNKYEDLSEKELGKLLDFISQIISTNKRKIHSIVNSIDKPLIEKVLSQKPSIFAITNRVKLMPIISGDILQNYISLRSNEFDNKIPSEKVDTIIKTTGGILFLTKEVLRSYPEDGQLDIKFRSMWNQIPKTYQEAIKSRIRNKTYKEVESLGIATLDIFKQKVLLTEKNPLKFVEESLDYKDQKIFKVLISSKNKLVSKDQIAEVIWGPSYDEFYSDWTIDQTISRFRRKIEKLGITPESLITIKGKGYKWKY